MSKVVPSVIAQRRRWPSCTEHVSVVSVCQKRRVPGCPNARPVWRGALGPAPSLSFVSATRPVERGVGRYDQGLSFGCEFASCFPFVGPLPGPVLMRFGVLP